MLTLSCRFPEAFAMKCVKEQDEEQRKGNPAKGASLAGFFVSLFPILYLSLKSYFVMEPHAFMLHLPSIIQWILLDFSQSLSIVGKEIPHMKHSSVLVFLETMHEYNTVKINQVFTAEDGTSLSVRCLLGTYTFEITNSYTQEVIQNDSIEETSAYIVAFIAAHNLTLNS